MTFHSQVKLIPHPGGDGKVKVAVNRDDDLNYYIPNLTIDPNNRTQFIVIEDDKSVEDVVLDVCQKFGMEDPSRFALMFSIDGMQGRKYVTSQNRNTIENGNILVFSVSAEVASSVFMTRLREASDGDRLVCLDKMLGRLSDATLARVLTDSGMPAVLAQMVIDNKLMESKQMKLVLDCLLMLMGHQMVGWDTLDSALVNTVAEYVTGKAKCEDVKTVSVALNLLAQVVKFSDKLVAVVQEQVPFETLIRQLETDNTDKQKNTLALMNGLFNKADVAHKHDIFKLLTGTPVRKAVENNMFNKGVPSGELKQQLAIMQHLLLNMAIYRLNTTPQQSKLDEAIRINELIQLTFVEKTAADREDAIVKLGFVNTSEPVKDMENVPPGVMALDCLLVMAQHHKDEWQRMVIESVCRNDEHRVPLVTVAVPLVRLIAQHLHVLDENVLESRLPLYPMLFKTERPFHDLFCVCLSLLTRTWREMNATVDDLQKVLGIVKEQMVCSLRCEPGTFDRLRKEMVRYSYSEVQKIWQQEREANLQLFINTDKISELKNKLIPELEEVVRENRLNVLKRGMVIPKLGRGKEWKKITAEKGKYWFWKLSSNGKVLMYEDCEENKPPATDELANKIAIADVASIVTAKECAHIKDPKNLMKKGVAGVVFSLCKQNEEEWFNFVVEEHLYPSWMDGLRVLLGLALDSEGAQRELDMLGDLELRIHLLDYDREIDQVVPE